LLGERQADIYLACAIRIRGVVVQEHRAVGLVARDQRHGGDGSVRRRHASVEFLLCGVIGRQRSGAYDFEKGPAVLDLILNALRERSGVRR
jgi:hypothetical protein